LDCDLALAVGTEVRQTVTFANLGKLLRKLMSQADRKRHELRSLIAGKAKHETLIARALLFVFVRRGIDSESDVRTLLTDTHDDCTCLVIESIHTIVIPNLSDGTAGDAGDVDVPTRAHFAGNDDETGCGKALAGDVRVGILAKGIVEDGVTDLIAELIGMTFCDGF
jgi:hypothetical protein